MATTSFSLGDHFAGFIDAQVAAGRYRSASEVMRAALRLLEDEEERRGALRRALQEGLDSGVGEPMTAESRAITAQHWSEKQAVAYLKGLDATMRGLKSGRRIGGDAELEHGLMKINHGSHVIYSRLDDLSPNVVRILHAAMDTPRHLRP